MGCDDSWQATVFTTVPSPNDTVLFSRQSTDTVSVSVSEQRFNVILDILAQLLGG